MERRLLGALLFRRQQSHHRDGCGLLLANLEQYSCVHVKDVFLSQDCLKRYYFSWLQLVHGGEWCRGNAAEERTSDRFPAGDYPAETIDPCSGVCLRWLGYHHDDPPQNLQKRCFVVSLGLAWACYYGAITSCREYPDAINLVPVCLLHENSELPTGMCGKNECCLL